MSDCRFGVSPVNYPDLQYYLMNKPHSLDIGSVSVVQCDMRHWPVFHALAIFNHLPISVYTR